MPNDVVVSRVAGVPEGRRDAIERLVPGGGAELAVVTDEGSGESAGAHVSSSCAIQRADSSFPARRTDANGDFL